MSLRSWPWSVLGIDQTGDVKAVRKAYADKLKGMDLDRDAAGYEMLRNARDMALNIAKSQAAAPAVSDDEWSVAPTDGEPAELEDYDEDWDYDDFLLDSPQQNPRYEPVPIPPEELTGIGPDRELVALLFPDGEQSDAQFDPQEEEAARTAMRQVIADAHEGDLARQQMGDYWIADRLASAWPRSAPLVAEAAEAFEWEKRHGQLGEGAAQAFITARLRGMRFHEAILRPGHWGHRAWQELSNPEKGHWWQPNRPGKSETRQLLGHIREHYPELESLLDWGKVSDLGQVGGQGQEVGNPWSVFGRIVVGIIILVQVLRFCTSAIDSIDERYPQQAEAEWTAEDRDALAAELFGPGVTYEGLSLGIPQFAQALQRQEDLQRASPGTFVMASKAFQAVIIGQVREMILNADRQADFDQLIRIKQLKLKLLELAYSTRGDTLCASFSRGDTFSGNIEVPPALRGEERLLAGDLLDAGKLEYPVDRPAMRAMIPGDLFAAAEESSGVSGEAASQAAQGKGSDRDICLFRKALLAEALRRPGNLSRELFLIL
jgi:hypothetical protein